MDEHPSTFGEALRELRLGACLSQAALAELANMSTAAVAALERGKRSAPYPSTVDALARALALSAEERAALSGLARAASGSATLTRARTHAPLAPAPAVELRNLPVWLTSFVGREVELRTIRDLLNPAGDRLRLLTLVGPGGVGKTRLAVAAAGGLASAYPDGVLFIDLAPLREPRLVAATIARALKVQESGGHSARELVLEYLRQRQVLLVVDNFEHVLEAALLMSELVRRCARVTVLATSRTPLRIQGEQRFEVAPLSTSAEGSAVQLFVERAREVSPDFALDSRNAPAVGAICQKLDGIPLAIELAAARTSLLGPEALLRRIEHRLPVLTGGAADLPERQQTLRATLAWSHDLLEPAEQVLFRRLAIFAGGWTLEAAESVCVGPDLRASDILECLGGLLEHSLVRAIPDGGDEERFDLLETVREYAHERLVESGELPVLAKSHTAWYTALAERAPADLVGQDSARWYDRLDAETDNLRLALDRALQNEASDDGVLRLVSALARFWRVRARFEEGRAALEAVVARPSVAPSFARVRALTMLGHLATLHGDIERARCAGVEALRLAETIGGANNIAYAQVYLGITLGLSGNSEAARALLETAVATARAGDGSRLASALHHLAVQLVPDELDAARAHFERAAELSGDAGDAPLAALALGFLAMLALREGRHARTRTFIDEAHAAASNVGYQDGVVLARIVRAGLARAQGAHQEARALYRSALPLLWREGHLTAVASTLEQSAGLEAETGASELAARLAGAVDAFCGSRGVVLPPVWRTWWTAEPAGIRARARAGEAPLATAYATGYAMPLEDAVALVAPTPW